MYKKYLLFLVSACIISCHSVAQKKSGKAYAVAFYNMENLFDTEDDPEKFDEEFTPNGDYHYTTDIYAKKLHNIAYVLKQLATDSTADGAALVGVAEVENSKVLTDLAAQPEIKNKGYKHIIFRGPDPRGINVGLLYNPRLFKVLNAYPVKVALDGTGGKIFTRDVLHVKGILADDTVHILVNHWPSRREGERESADKRAIAAMVNRRIMDSVRRQYPHPRIIVMGDMNDNPIDRNIVLGLGTGGNKDYVKPDGLFNPWQNIYQSGRGSEGFIRNRDLFDQVIISGTFITPPAGHLKYSGAEIFDRPFLITQGGRFKDYPHRSFGGKHWINGYSDHLPVILYLRK